MRSDNAERPYQGGRWLGWAVFALLLIAVVAFFGTMFGSGYGMPMTFPGYPFYGWYFFPFGFVFFVIFAVLIFRMVFWGFGGGGWSRRHWYAGRYGYGDAREILRQRYARGEIAKEQFDQMMKDLEQH
ncbi:MAG: SHOCT domain-containing protein [Nitrososphaerota archaeon]|jgi:uncharacterized membrane protein|nr:SHOCT domain-containing protein [Nitrososphaerota archaeon]MDG6957926.1 SHOCT domain-containing protein [Nitrososphaerota archaeon]MDG6969135.1 SHOCT domain-containing protein [Nitrososphaerota archaeon]MDG6971985.1 SHOCT domain-containing protein [Nitrososphaerota archaeon]MDG6973457.1 SHOCT domain-containing protein [Nitrososphaerota archaeon]